MPVISASRSDAQHSTNRMRKSGGGGAGSLQFVDDEVADSRPGGSIASTSRVQINVALNEDLSCSYKESQLASCTVEGAIQVSSWRIVCVCGGGFFFRRKLHFLIRIKEVRTHASLF